MTIWASGTRSTHVQLFGEHYRIHKLHPGYTQKKTTDAHTKYDIRKGGENEKKMSNDTQMQLK